jgi:hypothetical protein
LAGSFFHLWLARQAFSRIFPQWQQGSAERLTWKAFQAGSLAPDLGFFPGGPRRLSERIHHEFSGDFLRALRDEAEDEIDGAFAAGWALHLYTDCAIHPWVNARIEALLKDNERHLVPNPDLWHMRSEWGIDCHLLEQDQNRFLWEAVLHFPGNSSAPGPLMRTAAKFFRQDGGEEGIARGEDALKKWTRLLPRIFLWCGHTNPNFKLSFPVLAPLVKLTTGSFFGDWLATVEGWKNVAAVARPWRQKEADLHRAIELGEQALEAFEAGWSEGFDSLPNLDLDSGEKIG